VLFFFLIASRFFSREEMRSTSHVSQREFARGIALVLDGTAYTRECIGACWINKCILSPPSPPSLSLSLSLSLSRSRGSVLTSHSRLHRRTTWQRQKGVIYYASCTTQCSSALTNTCEYLLGKTRVHINSDINRDIKRDLDSDETKHICRHEQYASRIY